MCLGKLDGATNIIFLTKSKDHLPRVAEKWGTPGADEQSSSPAKCRCRCRVQKLSVTRSFLLQHHKQLVDAQLFPVVCAFAPAFAPFLFFALATTRFCDSCFCDPILLNFPTHKTPTHSQASDLRKSIHIVIASFKRENGDGATEMDPSSSPR